MCIYSTSDRKSRASKPSPTAFAALEPFSAAARRIERTVASGVDFGSVLDTGLERIDFEHRFPQPTVADWDEQYVIVACFTSQILIAYSYPVRGSDEDDAYQALRTLIPGMDQVVIDMGLASDQGIKRFGQAVSSTTACMHTKLSSSLKLTKAANAARTQDLSDCKKDCTPLLRHAVEAAGLGTSAHLSLAEKDHLGFNSKETGWLMT
jgi:hypothetical protein